MPPQIFRFHDIADVAVLSDSAVVNEFFEAEYGYHRLRAAAGRLRCLCGTRACTGWMPLLLAAAADSPP